MRPKTRIRLYRCLAMTGLAALIAWLLVLLLDNQFAALLLAMAAMALLSKVWKRHLSQRLLAKRFAAVIPGRLYRSGQISRHHIRRILVRHGIAMVIDLTHESPTPSPHQRAERQAIDALAIKGERFVMNGDGTGDLAAVVDAVTALHRSLQGSEPVLLHCAAGVQRTGHVLSAYLLLVERVSPALVYQYMERFGWEPQRSSAWPQQLNMRMGALAGMLLERGVIAALPSPLPRLPLKKPADMAPWWFSHRQVLRLDRL